MKVRAIIEAFDEGEKDFAKIVTLLQEMQAFGMPPDEIMKDLTQNKQQMGPDGKPLPMVGLYPIGDAHVYKRIAL